MTFYSSDRGISPVLGGILMFGLAMSLLILTQVSVVPAANNQVEFEHNQRVQDDFERFQASSSRVASSGATETVDVEVGVRYPNRIFLLNPTPGSGVLNAEDATITIENVDATNPETAEFFADQTNTLAYDTQRLLYEPNYKEYRNAPRTVHENGVTFNEFDGDVTLVTSTTPFVNDGDITLILLDGDVNEAGTGTKSLTLQAASAPSTRIGVTNASGGPITITFDTRLPQSEWDAFNATTSEVVDADYDAAANTVTLTLDPTRDYTLRVARLTIGDSALDRTPAYVTSVGTPPSSIPANSSVTYTVEVRDVHNNPVSGVDLTASIDTGAQFRTVSGLSTTAPALTTDEAGGVSVTVVGNDNYEGPATVRIGLPDGSNTIDTTNPHTYTEFTVSFVPTAVTNVDQVADVGNSINPGLDSGTLVLERTTVSDNNVTMEFNYTGSADTNITDARMNYYFVAKGRSQGEPVTAELIYEGSRLTDLGVGGRWANLNSNIELSGGDNPTFQTVLYRDVAKTDDYTPSSSADDFFILTFEFGDGSTKVYFVPVSTSA